MKLKGYGYRKIKEWLNKKSEKSGKNNISVQKQEKVMVEYISKYLSNKDIGLNGYILGCHKNKDVNNLFDEHSLGRVVTHFQTLLQQTEFSSRSGLSSSEVDEIINTKKMCEEILNFLNDLEKIYKLFDKKGIDTNYFELLSIFAEVIEQNLNKEFDKILIPSYKRISKRLGKNITIENVVKEFMKIPLGIEYNFEIISKLLDKFNLEYEKEEVERIIEEVREDINLEEFEQDLGSSQKIEIGDFEKLTGYEFEGYLKELFDLLGYTVVQTSLSGDQGADLIISKDGKKTVVQVKKYGGKVSNKAVQEIVAAKNHYKANNSIVVTNSSFTKSAIELALSNNVELWDGKKLKDIIKNLKTKSKKSELVSKAHLKPIKGKYIRKIKTVCPFCEEDLNLKIDIREKINFNIKCPHCHSTLNVNVESKRWRCEYCSRKFDTKNEAENHEEKCKFEKRRT